MNGPNVETDSTDFATGTGGFTRAMDAASRSQPRMRVWIGLALVLASALPLQADLVIPGANGTDGALNITANTVIDLSQAVTGTWDADNTENAGKGVYDPQKWAVVFKYSSVTVASGATVTFKNHPSRAPVVWLVNGDVTINGTVSLDGQGYVGAPGLAAPGPGGFRGGVGWYSTGVGAGPGFGPGGGARFSGGSFGTVGDGGSIRYGNPSLIPLLGGSGGGGDYASNNLDEYNWAGGGAGAGGLLVGVSGRIAISGLIRAKGGDGGNLGHSGWNAVYSGGGSGGSIRLVSASLAGSGRLEALGGTGYRPGGLGRIRLERASYSGFLTVTPDPSTVTLADGATATIWPPENAPSMKVVSIGGVAAPEDPRAEFWAVGADVALPQTTTVQVLVETMNVEETSEVWIRTAPRSNGEYRREKASKKAVLGTDPLVVQWVANVTVGTGYSALQVHVIRP